LLIRHSPDTPSPHTFIFFTPLLADTLIFSFFITPADYASAIITLSPLRQRILMPAAAAAAFAAVLISPALRQLCCLLLPASVALRASAVREAFFSPPCAPLPAAQRFRQRRCCRQRLERAYFSRQFSPRRTLFSPLLRRVY